MKSIILFFIFILVFIIIRFYFRHIYALRSKGKGFEFVYVENDGVVRELDEEEQAYLSEKFYPADGNRPYIKTRYRQLSPDGKISGFIRRVRIPKRIEIKEGRNS